MRKSILSFLAVLVLSGPAHAQFCPGVSPWVFDDVLASDPFCGYITWMAQNGVSLGCQFIDANHRLYCPNNDVPRSQIAAFLNRLTTQPDSTSLDVGTITKPGGVFLHNGGVDSTYLGVGAGNFSGSSFNVGVGSFSLMSNTTGSDNTGVGNRALKENTLGTGNAAVGTTALTHNDVGNYNSALGAYALAFNTSGVSNTALGNGALYVNVNGNNNTAVGMGSLFMNQSGSYNTAVGLSALHFNTTASENVALGAFALWKSATGTKNVALGMNALQQIQTNSENIGIGHGAGSNLAVGDGNIYVGNPGQQFDSQTTRIGGLQTRTFITGIRGSITGNNDAVNVVIDSNGQLGTISSSRDAKDDIADMSEASAALMHLRPVTFHYKADHDRAGPRLHYGLIAEEVADVYPGIVASKDGKPETVMYQYLAPMLLNEYQKQQRTIDAQAREIAELKRAVEVLMARTATDNRMGAK